MTGIVATLTSEAGFLTTDSLSRWHNGMIGPADKLCVIASSATVFAGAGSFGMIQEWARTLHAVLGGSDIKKIIEAAPAGLADVWRSFPDAQKDGLRVFHVGWADGGPFGSIHEFPDFATLPLTIGAGHGMQPLADAGAPGYSRLEAAWKPAAAGEGVEAFHKMFLINQQWSMNQGRVRVLQPGGVIGGRVVCARVDGAGIFVRTIGNLPKLLWPTLPPAQEPAAPAAPKRVRLSDAAKAAG